MAPETASALAGFKIPCSPIIVTRRRADSETSEASSVEENVSVQQSNLTPPQLKKATKKRVRKRKTEEPERARPNQDSQDEGWWV
mmetsp:Transcript_17961/g.32618  ORF Transcript_17961/g.32618 Transcript_17961/m.32618 type:complete len:85 (+) Transcript_17961:165-419(+)